MLRVFRIVALIEGGTAIALFFMAMPLKYWAGNPVLVSPVGMAHGVAFLAYLITMVVTLPFYRFSFFGWVRTTLAAFIPLGTFLNDPYVQRHDRSIPEG